MVVSDTDKQRICMTIEKAIKDELLKNKTVIIFGCTLYAKDIRDILFKWKVDISAFIDNNRQKSGKKCLGIDVYLPNEILIPYRSDIIVVICSKYNFEMKKQLETLGYSEKSILEISISENESYSDSLDKMNYDFTKIEEGYLLYRKIVNKYSKSHKIFVCPYQGTGDVYMACAFLPAYLRQENINDYSLIVVGNNCLRTAMLFEIEHAEALSNCEIQMILKAWEFLGNTRMNVKPLLYWGWRVKKYLYADKYPQITFTEMFRHDVFNLDVLVKMVIPKKKEDNTYVKELFKKKNLKKGKTIIIAPYAGSFVSDMTSKNWESLVEMLKENEYCVCTNCFGEKEFPIQGTQSITFPYDEARNVLEYAGGFIAIRSGLCDIVSSSRCKMVILYESGFNAARYEYFSLKKMRLNDWADEFIINENIIEDVISVFKKMD